MARLCRNLLRPFRGLRLSTVVVAAIAAVVLFFLEVPGRRVSYSTYEHGWPLSYRTRDYRQDSSIYNAPFVSWFYFQNDEARWVREQRFDWQNGHTSFLREKLLSPWSLANTTRLSTVCCAIDVFAALLVLVAVACAWQRLVRNRQRGVRFGLKMLLVIFPLLGVPILLLCRWANESVREKQVIDQLPILQSDGSFGASPYYTAQLVYGVSFSGDAWAAPPLLPESIIKLLPLNRYCQRVSEISILDQTPVNEDKTSDAALERREQIAEAWTTQVGRFTHLDVLSIVEMPLGKQGLRNLSSCTEIQNLIITRERISSREVAIMSQFRHLRQLTLRDCALTDDLAKDPAGLRELRELNLVNSIMITDKALHWIGELKQLEILQLTCAVTGSGLNSLAGLEHLSTLNLAGSSIKDQDVNKLAALTHLEWVVLDDTNVGDAVIAPLLKMRSLKRISFLRTQVSQDGKAQLVRANVEVVGP